LYKIIYIINSTDLGILIVIFSTEELT